MKMIGGDDVWRVIDGRNEIVVDKGKPYPLNNARLSSIIVSDYGLVLSGGVRNASHSA